MDTLLKIAVISDTHNHVPNSLLDLLIEANEIWHLGDVCSPTVLSSIEALDKPLTVVEGNMDPHGLWPDTRVLERQGLRFKLQHLPPRSVSEEVDAVLFGHLHCPSQENRGGTRILNPGAITGPRQGSKSCFSWLTIYADKSWSWDVTPVE